MKLINKFIRSQMELLKPIADGAALDTVRAFHDKHGRLMHLSRRKDVVLFENHIQSPPATLVVPRDELRGGVILYLHGGGYVAGSMEHAVGFASMLSAECGMRVVAVEYRLAPEFPYPAALFDALDAYRAVIEGGTPPERIILAGESAGAGLAYALCLKLRELGEAEPAGVVAISPWVDLTLSGESHEKNKDRDPSLTRERLEFYADCYVGAEYCNSGFSPKQRRKIGAKASRELEEKKHIPFISPLLAELSGMPPSLIFVGGDEILLSDATELRRRLVEAGCEAHLVTRNEMWHAYVLYDLKENRGDFSEICSFIRRHMPKDNERKLKWMHLDNAGKIYPASRTANWYNVFRLSMTLTEDVDRDILQSALDVTVRRFPSIAVRLRRGVFWYYLQEIPHAPKIQDEKSYPLVHMPFDDIRHCAFRVLHYKNRIACEFFHSLTDGNGALVFLKTLVAEYLTQRYGITVPPTLGVLDRLEAPSEKEYEDLFPKYKGIVAKSRSEADSYRIHGTPEPDGFCHVTTFMLRSSELVELAHEMGVSVTAVVTAAMILSAIRLQNADCPVKKRQKEVKVLIPCDLRRVYGEDTLRNFALYVTPGVDPRLGEYTLSEVAAIVYRRMQLEITEKNMSSVIYANVKEEENRLLRLAPLFLKNFVMHIYFLLFGESKSFISLSNLGVVKMPEEMKKYVDRVDFTLATQASGPYNAGIVSYRDTLYLNIIRDIKEPRLEMELYRTLRAAGIHVKVESNER